MYIIISLIQTHLWCISSFNRIQGPAPVTCDKYQLRVSISEKVKKCLQISTEALHLEQLIGRGTALIEAIIHT